MSAPRDKQVIVWDLDDVLNDFTAAWLKSAWQKEHPECRAAYCQLRSNPPLCELNTTQAEYLASLDRFRVSEDAQQLSPNQILLDWFASQGGRFRHHILTSRPREFVSSGAAWVFRHFGEWVRDFHFVPSPRPGKFLPQYETSKTEVLARLGRVDFFVDDSLQNVAGAARLGIASFVFPQPWNHSEASVAEILEKFSQSAATTSPKIARPTLKKKGRSVTPEKTTVSRSAWLHAAA